MVLLRTALDTCDDCTFDERFLFDGQSPRLGSRSATYKNRRFPQYAFGLPTVGTTFQLRTKVIQGMLDARKHYLVRNSFLAKMCVNTIKPDACLGGTDYVLLVVSPK